jgi:hypothetical protein
MPVSGKADDDDALLPDAAALAEQRRVIEMLAARVPPLQWSAPPPGRRGPVADQLEPQAFYINLDERPDRRASVEHQLAEMRIRARRVPAILDDHPQLSILKSHLRALELAEAVPGPWALIVEDDFTLARPTQEVLERIDWMSRHIDAAPMWLGDWEINGPPSPRDDAPPGFSFASGAYTCASCYFVRRDYIPVLRHTWRIALREGVPALRRATRERRDGVIDNIRSEIWFFDPDACWAPLQARDGWLAFDPRLGWQDRERFGSDYVSLADRYESKV